MASDRSGRELDESQRFPRLTATGRDFLHQLREDPAAPRWNWPAGEQLDDAGLEQVRRFASHLQETPPLPPGQQPSWLGDFVAFCLAEVPFYRRRTPAGTPFAWIPSCSRDDLAPQVWAFVPDSQSLDSLICFSSSGVTGHPAKMPSSPATVACGIPLLEAAMRPAGVAFPRGAGRMALTNVAAFPEAYTTASVISYLDEAGYCRVNLDRSDWRNPDDPRQYLERWASPAILGDPVALEVLMGMDLRTAPQWIASCTTTLSPAFAEQLQRHFGCPVADVIALTEVGILASGQPGKHRILPPDVYVEILADQDEPCPPGVRGEVTLTGGRNPHAPLLRYRTGDVAALDWVDGWPTLIDFQGRRAVQYLLPDGRSVHSMAVARCLGQFALSQYRVFQAADGEIRVGLRGPAQPAEVFAALRELFGPQVKLVAEPLLPIRSGTIKVRAFESELDRRI
ncbi:phenylacetate--CoA ligase family protein [Tuwongella immobilis]|uniref:AMP-dependent synthetase/ligase domain-containing protein n=1 Tax=Tuwongella immobilis TaxID=692036 RepID=A0A6C2YKH0_9BACT|nr:hypothetical protein [Tuwongella immobilis]VIP01605.1 AMP-dependent ligase OS=Janthinobacterium sp. HH01 GN=Jab_2c18310 PE=4 SV=1: AMP-binding [Tuwongella immobilis]VTR98904.1 AMP-dependent ligase OS=Janthinobacterium sp. HH01 GN=Jab_2c18310 PE=4 SV=1: AMP-binding [Tuwongella immobilis]